MPKKYTTSEVIEQAVDIHGMDYDYSKMIYTNVNTKFTVICDTHGEFLTTYASHIRNKVGCPQCNIDKDIKICTKCKISKPISEFGADNHNKSGKTSSCKECRRQASAECKKLNRIINEKNNNIEISRICTKCKITKNIAEFHKDKSQSYGHKHICKECAAVEREQNSDIIKQKWKVFYQNNKEKERSRKRRYYIQNKEKICAKTSVYGKIYKKSDRAKLLRKLREKKPQNINRIRKYRRQYNAKRLINDPAYKTLFIQRHRFAKITKQKSCTDKIKKLIGCDLNMLKTHIESQFDENMKWTNYGKYWEIDHIIPCKFFDHTNPKHLLMCWNYTNLQPLEKSENNKKSGSLSAILPVFVND